MDAASAERPATAASHAHKRDGAIDRSHSDWYKDAIVYQLHIKAFYDANGDGMGDFAGLVQRLDYIESLGVNAIWILPFYPSPLRDDGYDISYYRAINPAYGDMRDFRRFVAEAHRRGIRVITELVINHTSDQHPWFQKARRAKPGSAARNFYVWSDTDERYPGTRIIFVDTEKSNWTWDPEAHAFFWHRFYSHQPDLNFDNPRVIEEVLRIMRFWLEMGVDGLRLDAIPYLVEREGTNNENLPETHDVLKKIRASLDAQFPDRLLLAEANQWPEDTRPYFGEGDECHMAFHFPLMPRMYMAVAQEDRHPITDIIRQTPDIPEPCQWAIFLRNHDELTLEMVRRGARLSLAHLCQRFPRPHQSRHTPPAGAAHGQRPAQDRADERPASVDARHAGPLLRRRARHGRQFLSRRPRRRQNADAMVGRPQRRLQPSQSAAAFSAAHHGPGVRLPSRQRGGAAERGVVALELDAAHDRRQATARLLRARNAVLPLSAQSQDSCLYPQP
jgi:1,4-alpha-glucan branching enzyme